MTPKKVSDEDKERVAVNLCAGLEEMYRELRGRLPEPDLVGLRYLAEVYKKCRMYKRGEEILREVSKLTDEQKRVPSGGIIEEVVQNLATEEHDETLSQARYNSACPAGTDGLFSGRLRATQFASRPDPA